MDGCLQISKGSSLRGVNINTRMYNFSTIGDISSPIDSKSVFIFHFMTEQVVIHFCASTGFVEMTEIKQGHYLNTHLLRIRVHSSKSGKVNFRHNVMLMLLFWFILVYCLFVFFIYLLVLVKFNPFYLIICLSSVSLSMIWFWVVEITTLTFISPSLKRWLCAHAQIILW